MPSYSRRRKPGGGRRLAEFLHLRKKKNYRVLDDNSSVGTGSGPKLKKSNKKARSKHGNKKGRKRKSRFLKRFFRMRSRSESASSSSSSVSMPSPAVQNASSSVASVTTSPSEHDGRSPVTAAQSAQSVTPFQSEVPHSSAPSTPADSHCDNHGLDTSICSTGTGTSSSSPTSYQVNSSPECRTTDSSDDQSPIHYCNGNRELSPKAEHVEKLPGESPESELVYRNHAFQVSDEDSAEEDDKESTPVSLEISKCSGAPPATFSESSPESAATPTQSCQLVFVRPLDDTEEEPGHQQPLSEVFCSATGSESEADFEEIHIDEYRRATAEAYESNQVDLQLKVPLCTTLTVEQINESIETGVTSIGESESTIAYSESEILQKSIEIESESQPSESPAEKAVKAENDVELDLNSNHSSLKGEGYCGSVDLSLNGESFSEFNEWQYWRVVTEYDLPELPSATQQTVSHVDPDSETYCDCDLNENYISDWDSDEVVEDDLEESSPCYTLTPCVECGTLGIKRYPWTAVHPHSFWASGLNFCGHPRLLVQVMGNQAGKEKDAAAGGGGSAKKSKLSTKGLLRRGETKSSLPVVQTVPQAGSSEKPSAPVINSGASTTTTTGKSRAPPPPTQHGSSRNNNGEGGSALGRTGTGEPSNNPGSRRSSIGSAQEDDNNFSTQGNYCGSDREPSLLDADFSVSETSSLTLADTYQTAINGLSNTGSYYSALGVLSYNDDGDEDDTLRNQSDQLSVDSIELMMPIAESNGNLSKMDGDDGQVFTTTSAGASIGSDLNFNLSQRPMTTSFTLTRKRKVELSSVSSPVDDIPGTGFLGARRDGTTAASEQCLSGPSNDDYSTASLPPAPPRRYNSVSDVPLPDSNVLRKVASLTMAELQSQQSLASKALTKPKFLPEKLDFRIYEKFEGQMLINWFVSSFEDGNYLKETLTVPDMKFVANQFCTLLLAAGVLKQIEESEATPLDSIFRPDLIYYWSHSESPAVSCQVPGKLPPVQWPPAQDPGAPVRNGAKYTEAGEVVGGSECGSRTLSPEHLPEPGTVPKTVSHFESERDLTRLSSSTNLVPTETDASNPNPEFQQMVIGLKKEHKQVLDKKTAEHELKVFSVRGETQEAIERKFINRIQELEKECETLRTLISIQNLTNQVVNDFASPTGDTPPEVPSEKPEAEAPAAPPPPVMDAPIPPPPPPMMGAPPPPPPPPMMGGPPPPPPPPMMGGPPPPPPMIGGPPPPPPMAGGPAPPAFLQQPVARKQAICPQKAMKPLYWTRIQIKTPLPAPSGDDSKSDTDTQLWDKIEELPVTSWDDFTDLFGKQVIEKKEPTVKLEEKPSTHKHFTVLDQKRAQNVGIFVRSNKFEDERRNPDISKIRDAVLELDLSDLSLETVEKILVLKATDSEYAAMKDHVESNPDLPLDRADQFLYDLNSIPKFVERIMCFTFQFTFNESFTSIETKLSNFRLVCEQLMSSKDLKHVIALILTYGNYMNGGNTQRGQADGFTLDILPKLRDVKSNDNSYTFLHFIVSTYIKKFDEKGGTSEAKLPIPEPSDIVGASTLNFDEIELDLKKLKEKLKHCDKQAQEVIQSSEEHVEPFKTKMLSFLEQATGKLSDMEENLVEGKQTFVKTMKFFDYMPKAKKAGELCSPSDFFQPWSAFCHDFKEIWKNEQQRILKENLKEIERAIQAKRVGTSKLQKQPKKKGGLKDKLMERLNKQREASN